MDTNTVIPKITKLDMFKELKTSDTEFEKQHWYK